MENPISKEELIKIYKDLYLRNNNMEFIIEYESLIELYKEYLGLFFDEKSKLYQDYEFLTYIVNGFSYIHKSIIGKEDIPIKKITSGLCEYYSELNERNKKEIEEKVETEYTDSDCILVYSLQLIMNLKDKNLLDEFHSLMQTVAFNSYVIHEETEKGKGEESINEVEYRKRYNQKSGSTGTNGGYL